MLHYITRRRHFSMLPRFSAEVFDVEAPTIFQISTQIEFQMNKEKIS